MGNIYGASSHPVLLKKIRLEIWSLRDELEFIVKKELDDNPSQVDLQHIRHFYNSALEGTAAPSVKGVAPLTDSAGNEMDDDAAAMAAAMAGGDDESAKDSAGNEMDEAAAAMAAAMEGGDEGADDDAEAMALAMLEGQGPAATPEESKSDEADEKKDVFYFRQAPLLDAEKIHHGILMLADISMDEVLFFSTHPFDYGQSIVVQFLIPNKFILGAEVLSCRWHAMKSRIISPNRLEYRIHAKFTFKTKGERTLLREFLRGVEPDMPKHGSAEKKEKKGGNEEDPLADLGDLGL